MIDVGSADGDIRYVPGEDLAKGFCALAHESRYVWLAQNFDVAGKSVLDFGCGSGYGAAYLNSLGAKTFGVDISDTAVSYATEKYPDTKFLSHDLTDPAASELFGQKFDIIVSFDVIEHVEKYWLFVENIRNLLKKPNDASDQGGIAVIGCPNRFTTFETSFEWNPFHIQEFTPAQLSWIASNYFKNVLIYGQDFVNAEYKERRSYKYKNLKNIWHLREGLKNFPGYAWYKKRKHMRKLGSTHTKSPPNPNLVFDKNIIFNEIDLNSIKSQQSPFGVIAVCRN